MRTAGLPTLLALLLLAGCPTGFGVQVVQPPPLPPEPPMPPSFEGETAPELEPTSSAGLFRAPTVDTQLYYYAPDDLWYRQWRGKWYQAFSWNGAWFPPRQVPEPILAIPLDGPLDEAAPPPTNRSP